MPYYFGEGDPGWEEYQEAQEAEYLAKQDKLSPAAPSARSLANFQYVEPWEAKTSVLQFPRNPPARSTGAAQQPTGASPSALQPTAPASPAKKPGLLARLFGAKQPAVTEAREAKPEPKVEIGSEDWLANFHAEQKRRANEALLSLAVAAAALRDNGVRRVLMRYDGGNDEGFTHFEALEMADGRRLAKVSRDARNAIAAATKAVHGDAAGIHGLDEYGYAEILDDAAVAFMGPGFGTGPFEMYGAITIDCDACTITDEKDPARAVPPGGEET